jgi:hypothetical protein
MPKRKPDTLPPLTVLGRIAGILNRPMPIVADQPRCDCPRCTRIRAKAFHCEHCGYVGEPSLMPCDCAEEYTRRVQYYGFTLKCMKRGKLNEKEWPKHGATRRRPERPYTVEEYERLIARLAGDKPKVPCQDGRCCHGHPDCPVCVDAEADWNDPANNLHPWEIIRDVREYVREALARA